MWRHLAANALTVLIVALFLAAGGVMWGIREYSQPGPLAQAMCLRVESGATLREVSEDLSEGGAVSMGWLFRSGVDYAGQALAIKQGSFLVPAAASMEEIADIITRGGANTCGTQVVYNIGVSATSIRVRELDPASNSFVEIVRFDPLTEAAPPEFLQVREAADTQFAVLVVEGTTVWQVITALNGLDLLEGDVAELPPEGMLAPDTYDFVPGTTVAALVDRMRAAQERRIAAAWEGRMPDLPITTPEEMLILASIIEKETGVPEERRQVASVFVNRLREGMRLQTDPTVIYGVTEGQGVLGRGLRQSELNRETPWNTYVIFGLPPTPIANPSEASLRAAVDPDETPYIFFVADGTGGHAFADNLDDHNANVARWREIEAAQAAAAEAAAQE